MHNYYTILRISEDATTEEIKSAYRALAKEYHPDINPNNSIAEEYFKKINEAYSVLKDPIKRNWYNLLLKGNIMFQPTDPRKYGTRNKYPASSTRTEKNNEPQETTTQYRLQQLVLFLSMLWSLLIIYNNWFVSFEGNEMIKMVFAFLLFIVAAYFYINNLYNKWRDKSTNFNPESRSLKYFIFLFFFTIPAFFAIGIARKSVHMKLYPIVTDAKVIEYRQRFDDYWVSIIYFDEKNLAYKKDFNFRSNISMRSNYKIFVKYSTLEPRIMEYYIKLTGKDTIHQQEIDEMNKGNSYFKPTN